MSDIDTTRIKNKFYSKLEEEKVMKSKKAKLSTIIMVATVFSLTGITVLAANFGVLDKLFSNFKDAAERVQTTNESIRDNGVTMELSSYLADNNGIVPELIFTKNDGSAFAGDITAVGSNRTLDIKINNINRAAVQVDMVSDDGKYYYCLPIVHYDIENVGSVPLEISINKLIYNIDKRQETVDYDFYGAYKNADVKTYDDIEIEDLRGLFDNVRDNPVQTEIGTTIHSVVFAKVKAAPVELPPGAPPADGVDLAGLSSQDYDNIVGIKCTRKLIRNEREYDYEPVNLKDNNNPFGFGTTDDGETWYQFFRVSSFDDLKDMDGISFMVTSNNFIEGKWRINTLFTANQEQSVISVNRKIDTEKSDTTLTLVSADISLFSTRLNYEVKDNEGNLLTDIDGRDMNIYFKDIANNEAKLLYRDGEEINLKNFSYSASGETAGKICISYEIEMNPENYTLMNTSKLAAIVINGDIYPVE